MATRNAAVLPVPVCAWPATSRPASAIGSVCAWMGVQVTNPAWRMPSITCGARPKEANVTGAELGSVIKTVLKCYWKKGSADLKNGPGSATKCLRQRTFRSLPALPSSLIPFGLILNT